MMLFAVVTLALLDTISTLLLLVRADRVKSCAETTA